ncbi:MAG: hypothetical protein ACKPKO_07755, partial [Candidatus Fonsibacter sp.]
QHARQHTHCVRAFHLKLHSGTMYSHATSKNIQNMVWSTIASACLRPSWPQASAAQVTLMLQGRLPKTTETYI